MPRDAPLRSLPSVDRLLRHPAAVALLERYPRPLMTAVLREVLDRLRAEMKSRMLLDAPEPQALVALARQRIEEISAPALRPLINATGVILHTNLGRALLAEEAIAAACAVAARPSNLEYDLAGGRRGERDSHVEAHLRALTGAEAATVVNNNAAAVLLALNTLAEGREVVVSRGELIEIGGSFRIPEIIAKSGARQCAVGTTNRTHREDYERAIGPETAALLKVHTSNYRIVGFTAEVALPTLVEIGRAHGLPVVEDLGSGALIDLAEFGLPKEPVVAERVRMGADLVTFSGDKLLGGPQAGLVVGSYAMIDRLRRNPLKRALRCDKLTLAALEATLRIYRTAPEVAAVLPTLRALTRPIGEIERVAAAACQLLRSALGADYTVDVVDSQAEIGSGALPTQALPSRALAVTHASISALDIAARFRAAEPPIIGRVNEGRFLLDLRCIWDAGEVLPQVKSRSEESGVRSEKSGG